jgi:hypothetical protein
MAKLDFGQRRVFDQIRQSLLLNKTIAFIGLVYIGTLLFLRYAPSAPLPFATSLSTTPDWVSWFDVYITFPILIILCLLPFQTSRQGSISLLCMIAVVPLYLIFASYFFYYAQTQLGLWALVIPLTLLVPTLILLAVLAAPLINSLVLARNIASDDKDGIRLSLDGPERRRYFLAIASLSVGLAFLQSYLRSSVNGIALTGWVSDIGITVDAGARDLMNGINPYTHGLPPWGGPGVIYGPVTYLLAVPFTFLPPGWAAHFSALFYAILTSIGIWKCVQLFSPTIAAYSGALFLALPTTSWAIEGGMTSHIGLAAIIVWSLFMFFKANYFWAGLTSSLGFLTLGVPGILIIPYLMAANGRTFRLKTLAGFVTPLILVLGAVLAVLPPSFLLSELKLLDNIVGVGWLTPDLIFSPAFIKAVSIITTSWLVFWLAYRSRKWRRDDRKLLAIVATFLLLIPFTAANYFAFFYVWGSAVALVAILSRVRLREDLIESLPVREVLR